MATTKNQILETLLRAQDEGREPDLTELKRRFPGRESDIERIWKAAERYERGVPEVEATSGVAPGDRIGDFLVERLLGTGGMGHVFLARQQSLGQRQVALKVLPGVLRNEPNLKRFEREAVLLAELHHPRLAEVYGFGEERGIHYIAMRFIAGRTLHEVLRNLASGRLNPPERELQERTLGWAVDVTEALAVVHEAGLLHRDVKPSNILLEQERDESDALQGHAVLVDFGLVRSIDSSEHTQTNYRAATPAYASPEQLLSLEVDPSSDVYSLGITLHDLLTRRLPRERGQASAGLEPLAELCPGISPDLAAVVAKMLERDSRWRYKNATQLLGDLRALQAGEAVSARHPSPRERLRRWVHREPTRILRGGVAVAALITVMFVGAFFLEAFAQAREARRAWNAGDVAALARSAESIDALGTLVLGDARLGETLQELRGPTQDAPTSRVAAALQDRNTVRALREAATPLREFGIDSEPFLSLFLQASLAEELGDDVDLEPRDTETLRMVARLFYERPVETLADRSASAPFRRALLERWVRKHTSRDERLWILSAFSGLGKVEDVRWILSWARTRPSPSEELRLGFTVSERILRRAIVLDETAAGMGNIDHEELHALVLETATPSFLEVTRPGYDDRRIRSLVWPAAELACALGTFRRHAGLAAGLEPMVPQAGFASDPLREFWVLLLRAADQDEELIPALEQGRYLRSLGYKAFHDWGVCCGLMGSALDEAAVLATARERLAGSTERLRTLCLAQLDAGLSEGRLMLSGIAPRFDPDENTRLSANPAGLEWIEFALEPDPIHEPGSEGEEDLVALWRMLKDSMVTVGPLDSVVGRLVEPARDAWATGYLLMSLPGLSELRLRLRMEDDPGLSDWRLRVRYQVAGRAYVPYSGEASFELSIDGKPLYRGGAHFSRAPGDLEIVLPVELIPAGDHVISLRLGSETNTTFRLLALEIRAPE